MSDINESNNIGKAPEQNPEYRIRNFDEVCLGYTEEQAIREAERCLNCKDPLCVKGCPVNVNIPEFIQNIKEKRYKEALDVIKQTNNLPGVCGRVCPQEKQCEAKCVLGIKGRSIAVGKLERFVADKVKIEEVSGKNHEDNVINNVQDNGKKVAIIGSGPAGLSCATDLVKKGYDVTIYEALHLTGGVLRYGIPEFRLPKDIVDQEVDGIKRLGVKIKTNYVIGKTLTLDELKERFDAVFISNGAGLPYFLGIPGEDLVGVYSANEFLTRSNLMKGYDFPNSMTPLLRGKKTVVAGAGNVAMDAARTARRLGSEVTVVYRRTIKEAPARAEEIEHAKEEGIEFIFLANPTEIIGDKKVSAVKVQRMELSEPDSSGRARPSPISGSEFEIKADQFIVAIGQGPNPLLTDKTGLETEKGRIKVDNDMKTSSDKVFAGGDIIGGNATVIKAMGDGKKAAEAIDVYLNDFQ